MRHRIDRRPAKSGFLWTRLAVLCGRLAMVLALAANAYAGGSAFRADPEYIIDYWETGDGLPENSATAMVQAPDGYLWFGTFDGVVRFDGLRFDVFDPSNTPALPAAGVVNLHLDGAGRLWVSTLGGLAVWGHEQWRRVGVPDGWQGEFFARSFAERGNGDLLITTFDGRVVEVAAGERLRVLPVPPGEPGKGYFGAADEAGAWWVFQHRFVGRWDGARWVSAADPGGVGTDQVATVPARGGGWWVLTGREIRRWRGGTEVARRALAEAVRGVWGMSEDADGNLWICTLDRGLYRVAADGRLRHWTTANGLSYDGVRFACEDRERNVWVGTSGGGLMRFRRRAFMTFGAASGLAERVVNSVCADGRGVVWIGTYGKGLFRLSDGRVTPVPLADGTGRVEYVQSVLADRGGRVWVGTFNQGLWRVEGGEVRRVGGAELDRENVLSLFEDSAGRLWIGGGQGLWVYEGGEFHPRGGGDGRPVRAVCAFAEDARGDVWMADGESVLRFHEGRIDAVTAADGQPIHGVTCLKAGAGGAMWMGTSRAGLLRWHGGHLARVDAAAGLPARSVRAILEDDDGYFWMTSDRGVIRAARRDLEAAADGQGTGPAAFRCRVFDRGDGLPSAEGASGRQPLASRDRSGRVWVATPKGVAVVDPARIGPSPAPPAAHVEELAYETDSADAGPGGGRESRTSLRPPFAGRVVLPAGSRHVAFRYTAPSLAAPEKVRFQIRIDGRDADWQDVGPERVARYYNPGPGEYVFRVRAAGPDGTWEETGASLAFGVRPYFWQTAWFGAGLAVLLAAGVAAGGAWMGRRRYRRLTETARVLRESEERFRLVFEAAPNGMIMVDAQRRIAMVNAEVERAFGYPRDALVGRSLDVLLPDSHGGNGNGSGKGADGGRRPHADENGDGVRAGHELRGRRADGREIPVEVGVSPMRTGAGRFVLCSITDLSERKRAELQAVQLRNELAHLSRVTMLGELSGSLAHELNQPLTSILSNAQAAQHFLARGDPDFGEVREILADIVAEDKRAGEVIRRLRALFKKGEVQRQDLDVNEVVQDVLKLARSDLINHGIAVDVRPAPGLPPVTGDRVQLQQVLLNLIKNGGDAMENCAAGERRLEITCAELPDGAGVGVSIRDRGVGVPPADVDRIFEPFVSTKAGGMGLGLAVCRTIVQGHGGRLWLENARPRGATVHLELPAAAAGGALDQSPIVTGRAGG